jgi:dienelactone hydrolase
MSRGAYRVRLYLFAAAVVAVGASTGMVAQAGSGSGSSPDRTYALGTLSIVARDPPGAGGSRSLPTVVWYPAEGKPGTIGSHAVPATRTGPFPLLVFSQGYDSTVGSYATLLEDVASAGFVVAAPTFPHTSPADPSGLDEADITNHPADLRAVITALLTRAASRGSTLHGLVAPGRIGVFGHSDGADVTLAVAANSCCRDARVKAAAILSGAELASFGGTYFPPGSSPLLVMQGAADTINPPQCSAQIYDEAPPPKYYLDLLGASHKPPYVEPGIDRAVVVRTLTAFFEGTLAGRRSALSALAGASVPGHARLIDGNLAPPAPGSCPGAPA